MWPIYATSLRKKAPQAPMSPSIAHHALQSWLDTPKLWIELQLNSVLSVGHPLDTCFPWAGGKCERGTKITQCLARKRPRGHDARTQRCDCLAAARHPHSSRTRGHAVSEPLRCSPAPPQRRTSLAGHLHSAGFE